MERPSSSEYASFYAGYVGLVTEDEILPVLEGQIGELQRRASGAASGAADHRYAPGKWSVREVFDHLIDGERVFGYRAFCISRGDTTALPGFDEQVYVRDSDAERGDLSALAEEFGLVRRSNLVMLRRLSPAGWRRIGNANGSPVSVRALAYIMAGHTRHHLGVLDTRYGLAPPA